MIPNGQRRSALANAVQCLYREWVRPLVQANTSGWHTDVVPPATLALPSFVDEFKFDEMSESHLALTKANIVSTYQAGAFFGSLAAYISAFYIGRKKSLWPFTIIFIVGAGMMLGATGDKGLGLIIGGRVLAGFGVGGTSMVVPIYISEIAPPAIRGRLVGMYELGWQVGGLVGFVSRGAMWDPNHKG